MAFYTGRLAENVQLTVRCRQGQWKWIVTKGPNIEGMRHIW